jgi:hypothetical protein
MPVSNRPRILLVPGAVLLLALAGCSSEDAESGPQETSASPSTSASVPSPSAPSSSPTSSSTAPEPESTMTPHEETAEQPPAGSEIDPITTSDGAPAEDLGGEPDVVDNAEGDTGYVGPSEEYYGYEGYVEPGFEYQVGSECFDATLGRCKSSGEIQAEHMSGDDPAPNGPEATDPASSIDWESMGFGCFEDDDGSMYCADPPPPADLDR